MHAHAAVCNWGMGASMSTWYEWCELAQLVFGAKRNVDSCNKAGSDLSSRLSVDVWFMNIEKPGHVQVSLDILFWGAWVHRIGRDQSDTAFVFFVETKLAFPTVWNRACLSVSSLNLQSYCGLWPEFALLNHSCSPNTVGDVQGWSDMCI